MQHPTQRLMALPQDERRTATLTAVASALVGFGVAYLLLLTQPALAARATGFVRTELLPASARWLAPIAVAGVAIAASGLGIYALHGFASGVRRTPYLWLAPLVSLASAAVLLGTDTAVPVEGVSALAFVVPALLLALGGGALFQASGRWTRTTGALLWLTPLALLALSHLSRVGFVPSAVELSVQEQLFVFMVGATWVAIAAIAIVAPDPNAAHAKAKADAVIEQLRAHVSAAEARAAQGSASAATLAAENGRLERELAIAQRDAQDAAFGRSRGVGWPLMLGFVVCMLAAGAVAAHFAVQRPLQQELAAMQLQLDDAQSTQERALEGLRTRLAAERNTLEEERAHLAALQEEQRAQSEALASCQAQQAPDADALAAQEQAAAAEQAATSAAAAKTTRDRATAKARARKSARAVAVKRTPSAPKPTAATTRDDLTAGGDDPIAGLE